MSKGNCAEGTNGETSSPGDGGAAITVALGDASPMACELLAEALRRADLDVVHCSSTVDELTRAVNALNPDVALISSALNDGTLSGYLALRQLRERNPRSRVVMLLDNRDAELVITAFRSGAKGVMYRHDAVGALAKCIRAVRAGQIWASTGDLELILDALAKVMPLRVVRYDGTKLLTKREEQVVNAIGEGMTNRQIAHKLSLSEHTVKNYIFHIFDKLGVSSRVELLLYAQQCGRQTA